MSYDPVMEPPKSAHKPGTSRNRNRIDRSRPEPEPIRTGTETNRNRNELKPTWNRNRWNGTESLLSYLYQQLSAHAFRSGLELWKMSSTLHLFMHLTEIQCVMHGNPRYYWTYTDEDLVGMMVEIVETCHPTTMAFTVLFKWVNLFFEKVE